MNQNSQWIAYSQLSTGAKHKAFCDYKETFIKQVGNLPITDDEIISTISQNFYDKNGTILSINGLTPIATDCKRIN